MLSGGYFWPVWAEHWTVNLIQGWSQLQRHDYNYKTIIAIMITITQSVIDYNWLQLQNYNCDYDYDYTKCNWLQLITITKL